MSEDPLADSDTSDSDYDPNSDEESTSSEEDLTSSEEEIKKNNLKEKKLKKIKRLDVIKNNRTMSKGLCCPKNR